VDGVRLLVSQLNVPVHRIFILYGPRDKRCFEGAPAIKKNGEAVAQALDFWKPTILEWNPLDPQNVAATLTQVISEARMEDENEEIFIDISSTTKTAIVVSVLFTTLFGLRPYYVKSSGSYALHQRAIRVCDRVFGDNSNLKEIKRILENRGVSEDSRMRALKENLIKAYEKANYELQADSEGVSIIEAPRMGRIVVNFTKLDKKVLTKLSTGQFETLTVLAKDLHTSESAVGYSIGKLTIWGLVKGKRQLALTPIGMGIAEGYIQSGKPFLKLSKQQLEELPAVAS